jgi:hypothetical protein
VCGVTTITMIITNLNYFATRALLIVSLILIVVYLIGDPIVSSREDRAFYFAAPAIVMSIVAFGISFREKSSFLSILLVVNGIILVVDGIIVNYNYLIAGYFASQASGFILALVVLGTGIVKSIMTFRKTQTTKTT